MPSFGLVGLRGRFARSSSIIVSVVEGSLILKFLILTAGASGASEVLPRLITAAIFFSSGTGAAVGRAAGLRMGGLEIAMLLLRDVVKQSIEFSNRFFIRGRIFKNG